HGAGHAVRGDGGGALRAGEGVPAGGGPVRRDTAGAARLRPSGGAVPEGRETGVGRGAAAGDEGDAAGGVRGRVRAGRDAAWVGAGAGGADRAQRGRVRGGVRERGDGAGGVPAGGGGARGADAADEARGDDGGAARGGGVGGAAGRGRRGGGGERGGAERGVRGCGRDRG